MNISTACHRLNRLIIFSLIRKCGLDNCFRCNQKITNVNDMTVDHKINWLSSEDPIETFFDTENVLFSHKSCNSAYTSKRKYKNKEEAWQAILDRRKNKEKTSNRNTVNTKIQEKDIKWALENKDLSLRERARRLNVCHETLRRKLFKVTSP